MRKEQRFILLPKKIGRLAVAMMFCTSTIDTMAIPVPAETFITHATQQNKKITGLVKDNIGEPVTGASVVVKGTTTGIVTDINGNFALEVPDNATLVVSYIGFLTQEFPVKGKTEFLITLSEDSKTLDEVVVIGYGTRSKRDVTTAISNVGSESIAKTISMTAENAMQGTMTGVQVSGNAGSPMSRPTIRIRGTNSWGVSDPLYVVDGIPITEMGAGVEGEDARVKDLRGPLNIMTMIDPNDIESISVLKDASAAAIYGVRAANGVILITTKKGRKDKPTVDFSGRFGIQNITQTLDWLSTPDYTKFVNRMYASNPEISVDPLNEGLFDPTSSKYLGNSPTYNWQDEVRHKNAPTQDYSVTISGGTDNTDYYISLGYSDQEGALKNNNLSRYSGAIKVNTKINDWVKFGINYRIVSAEGKEIWNGLNYFDMSRPAPWQPIYQTDGIPGHNGYAYVVGGKQADGSFSQSKLYGTGTRNNLLGTGASNDTSYESLRNLGNAYVEISPFKGLTIKGLISLDMYTTKRYEFRDYDANAFSSDAQDPSAVGGGKSVGFFNHRNVKNYNLSQEFSVNYANTFGKHSVDFLFNFSNQKYDSDFKMFETDYMTTKKDYLRFVNAERKYTQVETGAMRWALQGYLFRIGYNYAYKYYLDATVRRDGSARFAPENRWGTFPSFSAAWRMKNEHFMESVDWLDDLKLRVGWGQLGNQEVRDMAYLSAISKKPSFAWGNGAGSHPASGNYNEGATIFGMPNRDLTWEKTETFNIGFDSQLFEGLTFSAEYYQKTTKGILQTMDLPLSVGLVESPVANIAKVGNRGFEFTANYNNHVGKLNYTVGANLSTVRNRVLETYNHIPTGGGTIEEGYPIWYHKAYKVAGIFQSDEEAQAWMEKTEDVSYQKSKVGAGDFYFKDMRGAPKKEGEFYSEGADGKINSYDMVYVGKSIPGFFYGFNLALDYNNFDFSAQFSGVGDVVKYNSIKASTFYPTTGDNMTHIVDNAWTSENHSTTYPRLVLGDPTANLRYSDFFFESGAYLRLQNVQLGYTLPKNVYDAVRNHIRNVRVYVGASNLFTITKYTGLDPENDSYPMPKVFFMGISAKF